MTDPTSSSTNQSEHLTRKPDPTSQITQPDDLTHPPAPPTCTIVQLNPSVDVSIGALASSPAETPLSSFVDPFFLLKGGVETLSFHLKCCGLFFFNPYRGVWSRSEDRDAPNSQRMSRFTQTLWFLCRILTNEDEYEKKSIKKLEDFRE